MEVVWCAVVASLALGVGKSSQLMCCYSHYCYELFVRKLMLAEVNAVAVEVTVSVSVQSNFVITTSESEARKGHNSEVSL
jgi:hypothetical protein